MSDTGDGSARPPLFGPGSQFHELFDDPRWAPAMIRATVLEAAHPQIGAALIDNSTFVTHPWRRLRNTFLSLQRMFGADDQVRAKEAARLNRLHTRLRGRDANDRPYDATDPGVRAWVVATLFESAVTMCRMSGRPLPPSAVEQLYGEFRAYHAAFGDEAGQLPDSLPEFWSYYDRMVEEELENTEAMRIILYKLFDHLPAPPLLHGFPTLWALGRAVVGPAIGAITVASLPESFRRRAGLPELLGAGALMQGAYLTADLARFLPEGWLRAQNVADLLALSPGSDDPRARTVTALQERMRRAGALLRLVAPTSFPAAPAPPPSGRRSAEEFFRDVLDQTGDGYLTWPDLAAMARELCGRLDLDEPAETRLYDAFADWWRELQTALDTDGDGRVSAQEYAAAAPALAGPALIRTAEVLFDAADEDGNGRIDEAEYRALFRTAFHRDTAGDPETRTDTVYTRGAFVRDFLSFMSGRRLSTPYDPLLADA
ncbi:calcium-binding protein [Streptomyces malaysiense]|uniref:Calcium-binding protein n=1 Tax=Streptomyces malaysiense TaxID=1428626 RepID=A0A1J4Q631_9ACTN|nr:oxygenase MpaB family protein [Streptomyces malaysiense]OIK28498.1 calcium-binding protein [Streptomyces malaysiense]